jgi:molybdate transport system ATP-binding protein
MMRAKLLKNFKGTKGGIQLDLDLEISDGQLIALYGPSGAGKTSVLRMLAGLLKPDDGHIAVGDTTWYDQDRNIHQKPQRRDIGYVFQDYALFPHLSVLQNLEFAAQSLEDKERVEELIGIMELRSLSARKPDTLSGGEKQRVALARALVRRPRLLLLDEPLAALDMKIRMKLQDHILEVHRRYALITILVSHDLGEIHKLSDWVCEIKAGKIIRQGPPSKLFAGEHLSGKFKFTGEVLKLDPQEVVVIVSVLIQNAVVKVIAQPEEVRGLRPGDRVIVASKAFNPVLYKME